MTPYTHRNPSFTVIDFDAELMIPVDIKVYYFNLTQANVLNQPKWELLYDVSSEYFMKDLSPDSFAKVANEIRDNE